MHIFYFSFGAAAQLGQSLLVHEVSRSHTTTHNSRTQRPLPDYTQHTTLATDKYPCPRAGFEPTISAAERPQTYALDRAATGTGTNDI